MKTLGKLFKKLQTAFLYFGFAYVGYQLGVMLSNLQVMYEKIEGTFNYEDVDFDYKVWYYEGDKGDYYTAPSPPEVDIDFIGFLPDTDLYECLDNKVIQALKEHIIGE